MDPKALEDLCLHAIRTGEATATPVQKRPRWPPDSVLITMLNAPDIRSTMVEALVSSVPRQDGVPGPSVARSHSRQPPSHRSGKRALLARRLGLSRRFPQLRHELANAVIQAIGAKSFLQLGSARALDQIDCAGKQSYFLEAADQIQSGKTLRRGVRGPASRPWPRPCSR